MLREMVHDPALLEWLDASSNRAGRPNENLARELMELFTLGIGHYTEGDIQEAARSLTGWTVRQGAVSIRWSRSMTTARRPFSAARATLTAMIWRRRSS